MNIFMRKNINIDQDFITQKNGANISEENIKTIINSGNVNTTEENIDYILDGGKGSNR